MDRLGNWVRRWRQVAHLPETGEVPGAKTVKG